MVPRWRAALLAPLVAAAVGCRVDLGGLDFGLEVGNGRVSTFVSTNYESDFHSAKPITYYDSGISKQVVSRARFKYFSRPNYDP